MSATAQVDETEILDAYSNAIISVVDKVGSSVVAIGVQSDRGESAGSGVFFAPDGYLLSNAHVVGSAENVLVTLTDGRRMTASVIGTDPATDLAVCQVDNLQGKVPYAELGNSGGLRVGQLAIAIGNPLGFANSVSTGVVSALGRCIKGVAGNMIEDIIQTTVPLNPGNSGGALLNSAGKVVGINTAIIAGAQALSFSVPINTAKWVLQEILMHRRVRRAWLGLYCQVIPVSREFRRTMPARLLAQAKSAVHVHQVEMGGPGQKGGIEQYDVIAAVNGKMVESVDDIYRIIGSKAVGTGGFQVTVIRPMINEWRVVDLTVPFMERPKAALPAQRAVPRLPAGASFE